MTAASAVYYRLAMGLAERPWLAALFRNLGPFVPLIAAWQIVVLLRIWPRSFLPAPAAVPQAFAFLVTESDLPGQVLRTIYRVTAGGLAGLGLGVLLGAMVGTSRGLHEALRGLIDYLQAVGEIGWLPLFIIWSGFNDRTIILTVAYTVFFPVFFGTMAGILAVPRTLANSVLTLGGGRRHVLWEVLLPGALPAIITGFRVGMGFGWRTVILAEMLIAQLGLGVMMFEARSFFRVDWILVGMVVAGVLWLVTDRFVLLPLESKTIQRWGVQVVER
ncbi:MAG: ABC transporter permease [Armatimonadetes bacterium]|nr:ABC transporter permease [Armatimonadota bacterium]